MGELLLATAGEDVRLWKMPSLSLHSVKLPTGTSVNDCVWSSNGQLVAYASQGQDISVAFVLGQNSHNTYNIPTSCEQSSVAFSNNSRFIVSGGRDCIVNVWDVKSRTVRRTFQDHINPVTCCTFNFNDKMVASSSDQGEIVLTELSSGTASAPLLGGSTDRINCLSFSFFTHSLLGNADSSGAVTLWDVNEKKLLKTFTDHHLASTSLAFSPLNDMLLCSTGLDKRIIFYDVCYKKIVKTINTDEPLTTCDFLHDGTTVAVGSSSGQVYIFDLRHGSTPLKIVQAHKSSVKSVCFQKIGKERSGRPLSQEVKTENTRAPDPPTRSFTEKSMKRLSQNMSPTVDQLPPKEVEPAVEKKEISSSQDGLSKKSKSTNSLNVMKSAKVEGDVFSPILETSGRKPVARSKSALKKYDLKTRNSNSSSESGSQPAVGMGIRSKSGLSRLSLLSQSTGDLSRSGKRTSTEDLVNAMKTTRDAESDSLKKGLLKFKSPFLKGSSDSTSRRTDDSETSSNDSFSVADKNNVANAAIPSSSNLEAKGKNDTELSGCASTAANMPEQNSALGTDSRLKSPSTLPGELPIEFIHEMINEAMEDHLEAIHKDMCTIQVEFIRQMEIQKEQLRQMMDYYSINDDLVSELSRLRTENEMLRGKR